MKSCMCGHAPEEHDPECHGEVTSEGETKSCLCVHYDEDEDAA